MPGYKLPKKGGTEGEKGAGGLITNPSAPFSYAEILGSGSGLPHLERSAHAPFLRLLFPSTVNKGLTD